jgi:hypothetical protein
MTPTFLTLPLELREMIYECLFSSITIRHGLGYNKKTSNRTAILRTCHQIEDEAQPFLAENVQFQFRSTEVMLDTLMNLGSTIISKLRHIHVKAFPFPLYASGTMSYYTTYHFSNALALLSGLKLDRLVVEDCFHDLGTNDGWGDVGTYYDIESLLESDGWKELHYVSPTTEFMTSSMDHQSLRVAQPAGWNELLQKRDGEYSGARVTMYLAKEAERTGMTEDMEQCAPWSAIPGHELKEAARIISKKQVNREVRIVARRGRKAPYAQDGSKIDQRIENVFKTNSWEEVKQKGLYIPGEDDPCGHL